MPKPEVFVAIVQNEREEIQLASAWTTIFKAHDAIVAYCKALPLDDRLSKGELSVVKSLRQWEGGFPVTTLADYPYGGWRMYIYQLTVRD